MEILDEEDVEFSVEIILSGTVIICD